MTASIHQTAPAATHLLCSEDLPVGQALPWPVYDSAGNLLLSAGQLVKDEHTIDALLARHACRELSAADKQPSLDRVKSHREPFTELAALLDKLADGLGAISRGRDGVGAEWIAELADGVESLVTLDDNALLGALLLNEELGYSVAHACMCASLCDIVARRLPLRDSDRRSLIAAALTSNVGMFDIQDQLSEQAGPLDDAQARAVNAHPEKSVRLLIRAGVSDELWLTTISQHHERLDGSGYPNGLCGDAIGLTARLLALSDIYAAMVLPRQYRDGIHAQGALRSIFSQRGSKVDAQLVGSFIKELGVFPPGALVRLQCGETAMVVRRNPVHPQKPIVRSVYNAFGRPLDRPTVRDSAEASPYTIVEALRRQTLPFTLQEMWGYR